MQRVSRALDTIWIEGAFDPRKPFDPDWASKAPAPVLRSGDEDEIFADSPYEHHHNTDEMQADPEGAGAVDPDFDFDDFDGGGLGSHEPRHGRWQMPDSEIAAIGRHSQWIRSGGGKMDGSEGHYVEYYPNSNVNHYYTYNPRHEGDPEPWNLVSTHWALHEAPQSRHPTFDNAVRQGVANRALIDRMTG